MPRPEPATPSLVRAINLRTTFDLIREAGPIGAPRVVRQSGLSRPTVADCIGQLLHIGLLHPAGRASGLPGPGAQLYEVNPQAGWVLSLDVGRAWLRSDLSDLSGATVARLASRTSLSSAGNVIAQLRQTAERLVDQAGVTLADVDQVVVGTPGVIRAGDSHFSFAPNLPGWESPTVIDEVRDALMAPVIFENDVNLAAIGEHLAGVARGLHDFTVLSLGSGVGMGVVLDGEVRHGASGLAGEIAYLTLDMDAAAARHSPEWGAGAFEKLVSASAILELAHTLGIVDASEPAEVFARARAGDAAAREVVEMVARRLAHGVAAISAVLDPELVVIGGGIGAGAGDLLVPPLQRALAAISPFSPRLAVSTLGGDAVLVGAAALGLHHALDRIFERVNGNGRAVRLPHRLAGPPPPGFSAASRVRRSPRRLETASPVEEAVP